VDMVHYILQTIIIALNASRITAKEIIDIDAFKDGFYFGPEGEGTHIANICIYT
jgi:hypothetical protein